LHQDRNESESGTNAVRSQFTRNYQRHLADGGRMVLSKARRLMFVCLQDSLGKLAGEYVPKPKEWAVEMALEVWRIVRHADDQIAQIRATP